MAAVGVQSPNVVRPPTVVRRPRRPVLATVSVTKWALRLDVSEVAPAGCNRISIDLFVPDDLVPRPLLWVCVPGGGMSRRYFDLAVSGQNGAFSMARHLASGGDLVVAVDPPGVGESDSPDDGYTLSAQVVADVVAAAVQSLETKLGSKGVEGVELGSAVVRAKIGLGHSAGALLVACQQARHGSYDALALLGFSASGLPEVLNEVELRFVNRPKALAAVVADLSRERFGDPLPQWSNSAGDEHELDSASAEVDVALADASSKLLALVGMTAIVPGSVQPELDVLRLPIFAALGEHDLAGKLDVLPGQLPACPDLTLFLLVGAGHNHSVAPNRQILWKRVMRWAASVSPE
ncbi:MAG TPA: alpha/beta fold hydrolase [Acidimicrobiales bacterium]|nr:alpha/beta fold hydrolase [Acidimicrobiales bacterium]